LQLPIPCKHFRMVHALSLFPPFAQSPDHYFTTQLLPGHRRHTAGEDSEIVYPRPSFPQTPPPHRHSRKFVRRPAPPPLAPHSKMGDLSPLSIPLSAQGLSPSEHLFRCAFTSFWFRFPKHSPSSVSPMMLDGGYGSPNYLPSHN